MPSWISAVACVMAKTTKRPSSAPYIFCSPGLFAKAACRAWMQSSSTAIACTLTHVPLVNVHKLMCGFCLIS